MLMEIQHQPEGVKFLSKFVEGKLTSPLLLVGLEGTGKRFSVLNAIQETFCTGTRAANCPCSSCYTLNKGIHPDVITVVAAEKDIGIDSVRLLVDASKNYPSSAKMRCFIIDGADRFTVPAANAFLKTLEEPPPYLRIFLLAETEKFVLPTIVYRCGKVDYVPLPESFILSIVQRYEKDTTKALLYSRLGEGSAGLAVQYWGSGKSVLRDQVLKVLMLALDKDIPSFFSAIDNINQDLVLGLKFLGQIVHDIILVQKVPSKVFNVDSLDALGKLGKKAPLQTWNRLAQKVKVLQEQSAKVNLSFHIKTILVDSF